MIVSFVQRNNKIFLRNKLNVFFSLLTVMIVISLYTLFLQKLQLDSIEAVIPLTNEIKVMVNEWMVSGVISITAVTTTLGVFGIYIRDLETKVRADFLTTTISRPAILFSYCMSSFMIGFIFTMLAFIFCQLFLVASGGEWLTWAEVAQVIGLIVISVLLSSVLNLFVVSFITTQSAFATINTMIGTFIGFLCGVYVPMGVLPSFVQSIIHFFPISHTTLLFRQIFMSESIDTVFPTHDAANDYMIQFGVQYEVGNLTIEPWMSLLFIGATIIIFGAISAVAFTWKNQ